MDPASGGGRSVTPQSGGVQQSQGTSPSPGGGRGATPRGSSSSTSSGGQGASSISGSGSGTENKLVHEGGDAVASSSPYQSLGVAPATPRSLSLASISSEGSTESHLVEQEDIVALCASVRAFKEALGKLRRIFSPDRDKNETLKVAAHERLGEVLRILRTILEKYSPIQHNELLSAASSLITHVNGFDYEDEEADHASFLESIDHLALAFSSRVSDYLMGDIDTSSTPLNCSSTASSRTKSCENILCSDAESMGGGVGVGGFAPVGVGAVLQHDMSSGNILQRESEVPLSNQEIDDLLQRHEKGVELALHRAKIWSKYAKDVMTYVEKRCQLGLDYARNQTKLANAIRPMIKEESFLPFQSIFCTALDNDLESCTSLSATCNLILGAKFVEAMVAGRNEHEQIRKSIKEKWHKQLKKLTESITSLKKARMVYIQRNQDLQKVVDSLIKGGPMEQMEKLEKKKDELSLKLKEVTASYQLAVNEANDQHSTLLKVKGQVLQGTRELMLQADQLMKNVTLNYFQLIHGVLVPQPIQFQTLYESARLYDPGTQYMEFVKRLGGTVGSDAPVHTFRFEQFSATGANTSGADEVQAGLNRLTSQTGSDTDSLGSSRSTKSADVSPTSSPLPPNRRGITQNFSSGEELEGDAEDGVYILRRSVKSKAADTHNFRKLKTPSRCRECDSYVYFHGYECNECGLGCHKKCLETLAIQCGHKRLPRKLTTFGVDLQQHLQETGALVPHLVIKCLTEIDSRGTDVKGIYRVSGLKSRVEKLCQAFENGAQLVDLTDQHPNVIANVLKLYLRQLPEPLLTFRLYPEFVRIAKELPTNGEKDPTGSVVVLRDIVKHLPSHHLFCLRALMLHLHRVSSHADLNNMPPSNLGIVFGPTLLRTAEGSASLSSLVDTVHQTRAIELLVQFATEIFGNLDHPVTEGQLHLPNQLAVIGQQILTTVTPAGSQALSSQPQGSTQAKCSRQEEQKKTPTSSRHGSIHSSSNGTLHPSGSVKHQVGSSEALAIPPAPQARRKKEVIDAEHDEWDWSSDEPFGSVKSIPETQPHTVPVSQPVTPLGATIVKTSLKDYVGLEMAALMEQRAESLEIPGHSKLKKSLSDTPPIAKSVTTAATSVSTTVSTNPSPTSHEIPGKMCVDSAGYVKIPITFELPKKEKGAPQSNTKGSELPALPPKPQKPLPPAPQQETAPVQHQVHIQHQEQPQQSQQKQVQVQQHHHPNQQKAKIIDLSQSQSHTQIPQGIVPHQKIMQKASSHQQTHPQYPEQQKLQTQQQPYQTQQSLTQQIKVPQPQPSAVQTKQQFPLQLQNPSYESMGIMKKLGHQTSLEETSLLQKKKGPDKLARQPISLEDQRRLSQQLKAKDELMGSLSIGDKRQTKSNNEPLPVIKQITREEKPPLEESRADNKASDVVPRPISIVSSRDKHVNKRGLESSISSQTKPTDSVHGSDGNKSLVSCTTPHTITIMPDSKTSPASLTSRSGMGSIAGVSITGVGVKVIDSDATPKRSESSETRIIPIEKDDSPLTQRAPSITEKSHIIPNLGHSQKQLTSVTPEASKKAHSYGRISELKSSSKLTGDSTDSQHSLYGSSPRASLENLASSDSSSLDFHTEGSQSSLDVMEDSLRAPPNQFYSTDSATFDPSSSGASSYSSICSSKNSSNSSINSSGVGGSGSADCCGGPETPSKHSLSGSYVSPYMSEKSRLMALGPSLVLTRSTFAQYDSSKRTITTTVSHAKAAGGCPNPTSGPSEDYRVRIQVPPATNLSSEAEEKKPAEKHTHEQKGRQTSPVDAPLTPPKEQSSKTDVMKVEKQLEYDI